MTRAGDERAAASAERAASATGAPSAGAPSARGALSERGAPAASPDGSEGRRWWVAFRRTPVSLWRDDIDHWAAALTYYSVLAVFPTLFVALSLLGMAHPAAGPELIGHVSALVPANSRQDVYTALTDVTEQRSAAWVLIIVGVASAVLAAYNYLSIFRRVLHAMHGVADRRPPWRAIPRTTLTALGLLGLLVASAAALILTSEAVRAIGRVLDLGEGGSTAWTVFKWPLLVVLVATLVLVVFRTGPDEARSPQRALPGGALAVLLWLVASAGFALYASHVSTYNRLYGSLAGIVVFLVWLWVSNLALLSGAQFNAELAKLARPVGVGAGGPDPDRTEAADAEAGAEAEAEVNGHAAAPAETWPAETWPVGAGPRPTRAVPQAQEHAHAHAPSGRPAADDNAAPHGPAPGTPSAVSEARSAHAPHGRPPAGAPAAPGARPADDTHPPTPHAPEARSDFTPEANSGRAPEARSGTPPEAGSDAPPLPLAPGWPAVPPMPPLPPPPAPPPAPAGVDRSRSAGVR